MYASLLLAAFGVSAQVNGDPCRRPFVPDQFDYSSNAFENFSYSYVDDDGTTVTVPLTTPATTPAAIKALVKEVWTNRAIPGRRWIYGTDEVDYTITAAKNGRAMATFGIEEGDYTPYEDGLTMLLVEGIDLHDDYVGSLEPDADNLELVKSVRLITSRMVIPVDNTALDAAGYPLQGADGFEMVNPGYIFNLKQPLYKFYFVTKGKPRRLEHEIMPWANLFEEFSPNQSSASDSHSYDVYSALRLGDRFDVTHDCSSVFCNRGHIMQMGSADGSGSVSINMSIFIPYYRNYADTGYEPYTFYDPSFLPFIYYYAITLKATSAPSTDPEYMGKYYDVDLSWTTNFRRYFHTEVDGEFYVYRVVDGMIDSTPLQLEASRDPEVTRIDGDRIVSHSPDGVRVMYREPIEYMGRNIQYVVAGRPLGLDTDLTHSNIDRVSVPGMNDGESFVVTITGDGGSQFELGKLENVYTNVISVENRSDELSMTAEMLRPGGLFMIMRKATHPTPARQVKAAPMAKAPARTPATSPDAEIVGYVKVAEFIDTDPVCEIYYCEMLDVDGTPVDTPGGNHVFVLTSPREGELAGKITGMTGDLHLFDWTDKFAASIEDDNSHADTYSYQLVYEAPEYGDLDPVKRESNVEDVAVVKAIMEIAPSTFSYDEIMQDEIDHSFTPGSYDAWVAVENTPGVSGYRIRAYGPGFDDDNSVLAMVQNSEGSVTVNVPRDIAGKDMMIQVGEAQSLEIGETRYVRVPLTAEQWSRSSYIAAEACTSTEGLDFSTYGSPAVTPTTIPTLNLVPYIKYNDANPGWMVNTMTLTTNIDEDGLVGSWDIDAISHYALWRELGASSAGSEAEEVLLHNSLTPPPYSAKDYVMARYNDPFTQWGAQTLWHRDGFYDPDASRGATYRARVYIAINGYHPAVRNSRVAKAQAADPSSRYMIVEAVAPGIYSGEHTTGIDGIDADGSVTTLTVMGGMLSGQGPIDVFNAAGLRVARIDDGVSSRPLPSLTPGIYLARNGAGATVKFVR